MPAVRSRNSPSCVKRQNPNRTPASRSANQSLASLYMKGLVTLQTALGTSSNKDELQEMINRGVGVVAGAGMGRGPAVVRPAYLPPFAWLSWATNL